jgi:ubiquinone/menaquinone biosynthesis C-methylase UbiE
MRPKRKPTPALQVCPACLIAMLETPLRRALHKPEKLLAGLVTPGMTVLDIGCGPGYFTLGIARQVGPQGRVIAVDVQPEMLGRVRLHAEKEGLLERIRLHQCTPTSIGLNETFDFALAFWMVHEVPDREALMGGVYHLLNPGGCLLVVEPKMHVTQASFEETLQVAAMVGFRSMGERKIAISRAMLLEKGR